MIHASYYISFSLSAFLANICTFVIHGLVQASNIHILLTWSLPSCSIFSNHIPIPHTSIAVIHEPFFYIWYVNTNMTFELICIHGNSITRLIPHNHHARETSTTLVM